MRNLSICSLLLAAPLLAQDAVDPFPAFVERVAITHTAGLWSADGNGLDGGGADYRIAFDAHGMRFEPALGHAVEVTQHLRLTATSLARGSAPLVEAMPPVEPVRDQLRASYLRSSGITERFDVSPEHVHLTWQFEQRPAGAGDLVVRYAIDTSLPAPERDGRGLAWQIPDVGGVVIGGVTGVDANGRKAAGSLDFVDGELVMSLPAAFVDEASYPLVLDPTIGAQFTVASGYPESEPDAAYDVSTDRYLVVWMRSFSATSVSLRGQLVNGDGSLLGGFFGVSSSGVSQRARVANYGIRDRFGVTWIRNQSNTETVRFLAVEANGTTRDETILATQSSSSGRFEHADIGCEPNAPIGSNRGFVVVYQDNSLNAIRGHFAYYTAQDLLASTSGANILTSSTGVGASYTIPALSRTATAGGRLLLVARRFSGLGPSRGVTAAMITTDSLTPAAIATLFTSSSVYEVTAPDVDGFGDDWIVAWQQQDMVAPGPRIRWRAVGYNGSTLDLGTVYSDSGSNLTANSVPSVGVAPGRAWVGYRSAQFGSFSLQATAVDTASGVFCANDFVQLVPILQNTRIVVVPQSSGGSATAEEALLVYSRSNVIWGQRMRTHGTAGTIANIGGGCGGGGSQTYNHAPGIGSSGLTSTVAGLPPTAIATIFNFNEAVASSSCGACVWTPFLVTLVPPIVGNTASVSFPIPCLPSLVGAQFETQWTTIDLTQAPCSVLPGLTATDRMLLTLGN